MQITNKFIEEEWVTFRNPTSVSKQEKNTEATFQDMQPYTTVQRSGVGSILIFLFERSLLYLPSLCLFDQKVKTVILWNRI